jgi:hypothetical protein
MAVRAFEGYDRFLAVFPAIGSAWRVAQIKEGLHPEEPWIMPFSLEEKDHNDLSFATRVVNVVISGQFVKKTTFTQAKIMLFLTYDENARGIIARNHGGPMHDLNEVMLPFLQGLMEHQEVQAA